MNAQIQKQSLPISLLGYITSESVTSRANETSRITLYENWLIANQMNGLTDFNLVKYKDYLMSRQRESDGLSILTRASAAAHINSIRARYIYMIDHAPSRLRNYLYSQTPDDASPSDKKAYVDEMLIRIREQVHDKRATVKVIKQTDEADDKFIRLTMDDMLNFCESPLCIQQNNDIAGVRDSALLSILCMTGVREDELVNLDVIDVQKSLSGYPALEVRRGKGSKQRIIPYGDFHEYVSERVNQWLGLAEISSGALFRGLTKWGTVRKSRISKRAINNIVGRYPAIFRGSDVRMKPHDCRRTYARIMRFEYDMAIEAIAHNMGHEDTKTTRNYIGEIDVTSRVPKRQAKS